MFSQIQHLIKRIHKYTECV